MKIRSGFVSNSSTTSFCIYGISLTWGNRAKVDSLGWQVLKDNNLETHYSEDGNAVYVGRSWSTIKDDETGGQFKKSIQDKVKELFGDEVGNDFGYFEEAYYNG